MNIHNQIPPEDVEQIERFLRQEMPPEERQVFLHRLQTDKELKQATEEVELLILGIQESALEKRLDQFHSQVTTDSNNPGTLSGKFFLQRKWQVAAAVLIIVSASVLWLFLSPDREDKLYAKYFRPDPGLPTAMSNSDNYAFDRAMIDYKTGQYQEAVKVWGSLLHLRPGSDTLNYFLGVARMAMQQPKDAIGFLEKVSANPNSAFINDAHWYLSLAWLKLGDIKRATSLLEQSQHPQKDELLLKLFEHPDSRK